MKNVVAEKESEVLKTGKGITFGEKDKELIKKLEDFQKRNELEHFVDAVRKLCEVGLQFEKTLNKLNK